MEEREGDSAGQDEGLLFARQLTTVSTAVESFKRRLESRSPDRDKSDTPLSPFLGDLLRKLGPLLEDGAFVYRHASAEKHRHASQETAESDGDAFHRHTGRAAKPETGTPSVLERLVTNYCAVSPFCAEVMNLLRMLIFEDTTHSAGFSQGQKHASNAGDGRAAPADSKLLKDLERLGQLLLLFVSRVLESEFLDTAHFRTCDTRRKVSAAVTTSALLASLGRFFSSSPSSCSSFLPPSPLLRLCCLQLLRSAVTVVPSPAAFRVASALGSSHSGSTTETEGGGDRSLLACLAYALEGPQPKLLQQKKLPGSPSQLWAPPLACNAAPEVTRQSSAQASGDGASTKKQSSSSPSPAQAVPDHTEEAPDWPVAWGRTFTSCSCLARGCGKRRNALLARLVSPDQASPQQATSAPLAKEARLSANEAAAAVERLVTEVDSGDVCAPPSEAGVGTCGAVPVRYALRQEALCLLLLLVLHEDKSVPLVLLQRPSMNRQSAGSSSSGFAGGTAAPASAPKSLSVLDLFARAFLTLRFDRRRDALVWLLGFRRAFRDLEARAHLSLLRHGGQRGAAGGGREGSGFAEIFSKGSKALSGCPDDDDHGMEGEAAGRGRREGGAAPRPGSSPAGAIARRLATGPVLHALAHLLHAFTSRETLEQLLRPLDRRAEDAGDRAAPSEASSGSHSQLYLALFPSAAASPLSSSPASSPSWVLQSLLLDLLFFVFPPATLAVKPPQSFSTESLSSPSPSSPHAGASAHASLLLSFLQSLRPLFLPPQQELLLAALSAYPLGLHVQFLESLSSLHLAARSSVQFALSHHLLVRLLLLPLGGHHSASLSSLASVSPSAESSSAVSFSSPPLPQGPASADFSASAAVCGGVSTAEAAETLQAAAKVQLREAELGEQRRQYMRSFVSLVSPPRLLLRQHLTATLLHSSPSVNFFGLLSLRAACRLYEVVGQALDRAPEAADGVWGGESVPSLLRAAVRDRLPDEKTVLNCLKKLEQHFLVFRAEEDVHAERTSKKKNQGMTLAWDLDGWDADALWPTDEALVKDQVTKELKGDRNKKNSKDGANASDPARDGREGKKTKNKDAEDQDEDDDLDLHLGGIEDDESTDEESHEERADDRNNSATSSSPNGDAEDGGAGHPSLAPSFILQLSLRRLRSQTLPLFRVSRSKAAARADAASSSESSDSSSAWVLPTRGHGQEETEEARAEDGKASPLSLLLSCLDVARLYQTLLLPPGGFSFDWSRLLVSPARPLPVVPPSAAGGVLVCPFVWALEPEAGAAVVALGLQSLGGGRDGLEGLRFGFQVGSTVSKQAMIFLTQLLFQWRKSTVELERVMRRPSAAERNTALMRSRSAFSENLLALLFRCLSVSPVFATARVNELAVWLAALSPRSSNRDSLGSTAQARSHCFRCAASYFLSIVKLAIEKPLLLLPQPPLPPAASASCPIAAARSDAGEGVSLFTRALLSHLSLAPECNGGRPLYVDVSGASLSLFQLDEAGLACLSHSSSCPVAQPCSAAAKRDTALCANSIGSWVTRGLLGLLSLRPCLLEPVRELLRRQGPWRVVGSALTAARDVDAPEDAREAGEEEASEEKTAKGKKQKKRDAAQHSAADGEERENKRGDGEDEDEEKAEALEAMRKTASRHPLYATINGWRKRLSAVLREASRLAEEATQEGAPGTHQRENQNQESSCLAPAHLLLSEAMRIESEDSTDEVPSSSLLVGASLSLVDLLRQLQPSRALSAFWDAEVEMSELSSPLVAPRCGRVSSAFPLPLSLCHDPYSPEARICLPAATADAVRLNLWALLRLCSSLLRCQTLASSSSASSPHQGEVGNSTHEQLVPLLRTMLHIQHLQRLLDSSMKHAGLVASPSLYASESSSATHARASQSVRLPRESPFPLLTSSAPSEICDAATFACILTGRAGGRALGEWSRRRLEELRKAIDKSSRSELKKAKKSKHGHEERTDGERRGDESEEGERRRSLELPVLSCTYITTVLLWAAEDRRLLHATGSKSQLPVRLQASQSPFFTLARELLPQLLTHVAIPLSRLAALDQRRRAFEDDAVSELHRKSRDTGASGGALRSLSALQRCAHETLQRICAAASAWGFENETLVAPAITFLHAALGEQPGDDAETASLVALARLQGHEGDVDALSAPSAQGQASNKEKRKKKRRAREEDADSCFEDRGEEASPKKRKEGGKEGIQHVSVAFAASPAGFPVSLEGTWPLDLAESYICGRLASKAPYFAPAHSAPEGPDEPRGLFSRVSVSEFSLSSTASRVLSAVEVRLLLGILRLASEPAAAPAAPVFCDTQQDQDQRVRMAELLVLLLDCLAKPVADRGACASSQGLPTELGRQREAALLEYERVVVRQCFVPASAQSVLFVSGAARKCASPCRAEHAAAAAKLWHAQGRIAHPSLASLFCRRFRASVRFRKAVQLELLGCSDELSSCAAAHASPAAPAGSCAPADNPPGQGLLPQWRFALELLLLREGQLPPDTVSEAGDVFAGVFAYALSLVGEAESHKEVKTKKKERKQRKTKQAAMRWGASILRLLFRVCGVPQSLSAGIETGVLGGDGAEKEATREGGEELQASPVGERALMTAALDFYEGRDRDAGMGTAQSAKDDERGDRSPLWRSSAVAGFSTVLRSALEIDADDSRSAGDSQTELALLQRAVIAIRDSLLAFAASDSLLPPQGGLAVEGDEGGDGALGEEETERRAAAGIWARKATPVWMAVGLYEAISMCATSARDDRSYSKAKNGSSCDAGEAVMDDADAKSTTVRWGGDAREKCKFLSGFLRDAFAGVCCQVFSESLAAWKASAAARAFLPPTSPSVACPSYGLLLPPSSFFSSSPALQLLECLEEVQRELTYGPRKASEGRGGDTGCAAEDDNASLLLDFISRIRLTRSLERLVCQLPSRRTDFSDSAEASASPLPLTLSPSLRQRAERGMLRLARSFARRVGGLRELDMLAVALASKSAGVKRRPPDLHPQSLLASVRERAALFAEVWCQTFVPVWRSGLVAAALLPPSKKAKKALEEGAQAQKAAEGGEAIGGDQEEALRQKRVWILAQEILQSDALRQLGKALRFLCYAAARDASAEGGAGAAGGEQRRSEIDAIGERSTKKAGEDAPSTQMGKVQPGSSGHGARREDALGAKTEEAHDNCSPDLRAALFPLLSLLARELLPIYYTAVPRRDAQGASEESRNCEGGNEWADTSYYQEEGGYEGHDYERDGYSRNKRSFFFADDEEEAAREGSRMSPGGGDDTNAYTPFLLEALLPPELHTLFASFYGGSTSAADCALRDIFTADRSEVQEAYIHSSFAFTSQRASADKADSEQASDASGASPLVPVTVALAWAARLPQPREEEGREKRKPGQQLGGEDEAEGEDAALLLLNFLRHQRAAGDADAAEASEEEGARKQRKEKRKKDRERDRANAAAEGGETGTRGRRDDETKRGFEGAQRRAWSMEDLKAFFDECDQESPAASLSSVVLSALSSSSSGAGRSALDWLSLNPARMQRTLDSFSFSCSLSDTKGVLFSSLPGRSADVTSSPTDEQEALSLVFALPCLGGKHAGVLAGHEAGGARAQASLALSAVISGGGRGLPATGDARATATFCQDVSARGTSSAAGESSAQPKRYDVAYLVPFLTGRLVAACASLLYRMRDEREAAGRKTELEDGLPGDAGGDQSQGTKPEDSDTLAAVQPSAGFTPRDSAASLSFAALAKRACGAARRWLQRQRGTAEAETPASAPAKDRRRRRKRRRDGEEDDGEEDETGYTEEAREPEADAEEKADVDSRLAAAFDVEEVESATSRVWAFLNAARQLQTRQRMRSEQKSRLRGEGGEGDEGGDSGEEGDGADVNDEENWMQIEELEGEDAAEAELAAWAKEREKVDDQGTWLRRFAAGGGLQVLLMTLSATDGYLRSVAFHGVAMFSHLLQLSADLTILLSFSEQHFLLSKIEALTAALAAAEGCSGDAATSNARASGSPGEAGSQRKPSTAVLAARRRKFSRQLEQHRSFFAFRELRQIQLLLSTLKNSVPPPTAIKARASAAHAAAEAPSNEVAEDEYDEEGDEVYEGRSRGRSRKRRRQRQRRGEEEGDEYDEDCMQTDKQVAVEGNRDDTPVCPEALHPVLTAFAASALPFLLQPEHPLFSLLNDFLLQRPSLSALLFASPSSSAFLYPNASSSCAASAASPIGQYYAPSLGSLFSTFLLSPVSASSLQQKQFVLTCLLRSLAASSSPSSARGPSVSSSCPLGSSPAKKRSSLGEESSSTASLLLPPSSLFLFSSSPVLSFSSFGSPFPSAVFAALRLSLQLPPQFSALLENAALSALSATTSCRGVQGGEMRSPQGAGFAPAALPIACWNACVLLQRPGVLSWLLHHLRLLLFHPSSSTSSFSSTSAPLAPQRSLWSAFLSSVLQPQALPLLSSPTAASLWPLVSDACSLGGEGTENRSAFHAQRKEALAVARDALELVEALVDASLLSPRPPGMEESSLVSEAIGAPLASYVSSSEGGQEIARERAEKLREDGPGGDEADIRLSEAFLGSAVRREVLKRLLRRFVASHGRVERACQGLKTRNKAQPTGVSQDDAGSASDSQAPSSAVLPSSRTSSLEGAASVLFAPEVVAWPVSLGFPSSPLARASRASYPVDGQGKLAALARQVALLRSKLLGIRHSHSASGASPEDSRTTTAVEASSPLRVQVSPEGVALLLSLFECLRFLVRLWYALCLSGCARAASSLSGASAGVASCSPGADGGRRRRSAEAFMRDLRAAGRGEEMPQVARRLFALCWRLCWSTISLFQPIARARAHGSGLTTSSASGPGAPKEATQTRAAEREIEADSDAEDDEAHGRKAPGAGCSPRQSSAFSGTLAPLQSAQLNQLRHAASGCFADVVALCELAALSCASRGEQGDRERPHNVSSCSPPLSRHAGDSVFGVEESVGRDDACRLVLDMLTGPESEAAPSRAAGETANEESSGSRCDLPSEFPARRRKRVEKKEQVMLQCLQIWCLLCGGASQGSDICRHSPTAGPAQDCATFPAMYIRWVLSGDWLS
ncbi:hypothetical protein BESB_046990 [Besnoitia besnoiti]|uniref:Uncharacterized protein n=1 Tax=Besnoitia besnoiti TaxID=94643 RepID=A0A2A9MLI5_BESBE|nr:hypothetical protein BESB_046990 [Besnoitia besnoiti]PFH36507.1 hypothetical protein BESB_046990 [Besnoitia besnoiti]